MRVCNALWEGVSVALRQGCEDGPQRSPHYHAGEGNQRPQRQTPSPSYVRQCSLQGVTLARPVSPSPIPRTEKMIPVFPLLLFVKMNALSNYL